MKLTAKRSVQREESLVNPKHRSLNKVELKWHYVLKAGASKFGILRKADLQASTKPRLSGFRRIYKSSEVVGSSG